MSRWGCGLLHGHGSRAQVTSSSPTLQPPYIVVVYSPFRCRCSTETGGDYSSTETLAGMDSLPQQLGADDS